MTMSRIRCQAVGIPNTEIIFEITRTSLFVDLDNGLFSMATELAGVGMRQRSREDLSVVVLEGRAQTSQHYWDLCLHKEDAIRLAQKIYELVDRSQLDACTYNRIQRWAQEGVGSDCCQGLTQSD